MKFYLQKQVAGRSSDLALAYLLVTVRHWPEVRIHIDPGALADGVSAL